MSRFEAGVMFVALHEVREPDCTRVFNLASSLLLDLAGVDRLDIRCNGRVLAVRIHETAEKGRALRW